MAGNAAGRRGPDKRQDRLQDARHGTYDPVANTAAPDTNQQSPHERAQAGADVRGDPAPADSAEAMKQALPEGLKRERRARSIKRMDGEAGRLTSRRTPRLKGLLDGRKRWPRHERQSIRQ
jgi:hypothetical protein